VKFNDVHARAIPKKIVWGLVREGNVGLVVGEGVGRHSIY
jgi:hypothetical protein